jgi:hypothetical protein
LKGIKQMKNLFALLATSSMFILSSSAHAQIMGSIGNFDVVNDTGETAEGFEIEIEDINPSDITRAFPSNFSSQEYVQRFGIPTIAAYDDTATGGKKGVRVTWAASWNGTKWAAKWGSYSSDGVAYVAKPTLTQGDSCWLLGQGANYAKSGCDHFGLSFLLGTVLGKTSYHWKVPDAASPTILKNAPWVAPTQTSPFIPVFAPVQPIPPMPVQNYVPPAAPALPPVIHAVAEAPEAAEPAPAQWGEAFWVKTFTSVSKVPVDLDNLQKNRIPLKNAAGAPKVKIGWALLQRAPAGAAVELEKKEIDDDPVPAGGAGLIKRYEYYRYSGVYDLDTLEAICAPELPKSNGPCTSGPRAYTYTDPVTALSRRVNEKGKFVGAHMDGFNLP